MNEPERCSRCGELKSAEVESFCMNCRKMELVNSLNIHLEPKDCFTVAELEDWAIQNGWVPEDDTLNDAPAKTDTVKRSDVNAAFARAKKHITKLHKSSDLTTIFLKEMIKAVDDLADAVYGLVGEDEDEAE